MESETKPKRPMTKAQIEGLIKAIEKNNRMSPESKEKALKKLKEKL